MCPDFPGPAGPNPQRPDDQAAGANGWKILAYLLTPGLISLAVLLIASDTYGFNALLSLLISVPIAGFYAAREFEKLSSASSTDSSEQARIAHPVLRRLLGSVLFGMTSVLLAFGCCLGFMS